VANVIFSFETSRNTNPKRKKWGDIAYTSGRSRDRQAPGTLRASAQFVPLPAEAGCETC